MLGISFRPSILGMFAQLQHALSQNETSGGLLLKDVGLYVAVSGSLASASRSRVQLLVALSLELLVQDVFEACLVSDKENHIACKGALRPSKTVRLTSAYAPYVLPLRDRTLFGESG